MRPLPTYRIEPPDIIQIEITSAKAARGGENQPAKKSDEVKPSGSAATESGSSNLNVTGAVTPGENKTGGGSCIISGENKFTGNGGGTGTLSGTPADFKSGGVPNLTLSSGTPADNVAGSTTVSGGTLTLGSAVAVGPLNKTATGTLTLSSPNTYSGITTVSSGEIRGYTGEPQNTYKGENLTIADNFTGTYDVIVGNSKPTATFVASNAPPSTESMKITRTGRGISGADLGSGQYLVGPDGTINMRQYGMVQVTGMTIAELKAALEKHLSKFMESPEVWVDVSGYNSKVFYVITDGAGSGDNERRIPITGNETVLYALAAIGGLSQFSSKKIWVSRPSPTNSRKGTILTVDYAAITQRGATETNYQIMPGDRIFIAPDSAIAINIKLGKVTAPMERVMGLIGLGSSTIQSVKRLMGEDKDHHGADEDDW
jgi:autotransporter-associated beta strand protein